MNPLLIIGSAPCIYADLEALLPLFDDLQYDVMLVGMDSTDKYLDRVKYFATYHPADIPESIRRRQEAGGNTDFQVISHIAGEGIHIVFPYQQPSGSSALLGVLFATKIGYQKIILAGCPLEDEKYTNFRQGWQAHLDEYVGRVRSMSGWTREFLSPPTREWLDSEA